MFRKRGNDYYGFKKFKFIYDKGGKIPVFYNIMLILCLLLVISDIVCYNIHNVYFILHLITVAIWLHIIIKRYMHGELKEVRFLFVDKLNDENTLNELRETFDEVRKTDKENVYEIRQKAIIKDNKLEFVKKEDK